MSSAREVSADDMAASSCTIAHWGRLAASPAWDSSSPSLLTASHLSLGLPDSIVSGAAAYSDKKEFRSCMKEQLQCLNYGELFGYHYFGLVLKNVCNSAPIARILLETKATSI
uniref:Uncharacterized protein n=1 Tax=Romanomermis culicivorax TaxID=13658 RepID=A0A915IAH0_ROMCU